MAQLLEASAGTGKTFRIANAVLLLVVTPGRFAHNADGVPIDAMVVLTFTKAATAELRERVRRRLRQALDGLEAADTGRAWAAPDELLREFVDGTGADQRAPRMRRLRRALRDFDLAGIATLHGLCQQLLRRNALRSGWLLDAKVESELPDLVADLAMDFWTRLVHDADPSVLPALESAGVTLRALTELARKASDPELAIVPPLESLGDPPDRLPDLAAWGAAKAALEQAWDPSEVEQALADPDVTVHAINRSRGLNHSLPPGRARGRAWQVRTALNAQRPSPADALPDAFATFAPDSIARATHAGATPPSCPSLIAMAGFVADPTRNRLDAAAGRLELSAIFDWFAEDFVRDAGSVREYVARYAPLADADWILDAKVSYLDYDWSLNDASRTWPGTVSPSTSRTTSSPARGFAGNRSDSSRPTIASAIACSVNPAAGRVVIWVPSRRTVTRSAIRATSSSLCEV